MAVNCGKVKERVLSIPAAMQSVINQMNLLAEKVGLVEDRLALVLRCKLCDSVPTASADKETDQCKMHGELLGLLSGLLSLSDRLDSVVERLEI